MKIEITVNDEQYKMLKILAANDGVSVEDLIFEEIELLVKDREYEIDEYYDRLDDEDENFNKFTDGI